MNAAVCRNLRAARAAAQLKQDDVAERMRELGFAAWRHSTVSLTERGQRRITVDELLGLAVAFEVSVQSLLEQTS